MNIFVAKLSSGTTDADLNELFGQFGTVTSAKVIIDRETGYSKKYGFVEMSDDEAASGAIDQLNESEFDGSEIVVKQARAREERSNNSRGGYQQSYDRRY